MKNKIWTGFSIVLIAAGIIIGLVLAAEFNIIQNSNADTQKEKSAATSTAGDDQENSRSSIEILDAISNAFADVAEKVNPSVVTISTKTVIKNKQGSFR